MNSCCRVKSIFRRVREERSDMLRAEQHPALPRAPAGFHRQSLQVALTAKEEFDLLQEFDTRPRNVLTRETLMDKVWGYHGDATSRTLDTHVRRLREKLGDDGSQVETVRGVGYRLGSAAETG